MFLQNNYTSVKTLKDIAKYSNGSIPLNFEIFYNKYLTDKGNLISFITYAANNQDWSPDPEDIKDKISKNGEVYLTLKQVAYILANYILGNNIKQKEVIARTVGGNKTFYSGGNSTFQLISYFSAMYFWMQDKELGYRVVCYSTIISNSSETQPPESPLGSSNISYNCVNSLADNQSNTLRVAYGASNPGGSFMNNADQEHSAQEESAFKMYPELAVGLFILPYIAGNNSLSPTIGWLVMGTRTYNELLPIGSSITRELGKPREIKVFGSLNKYTMAKGGVLGISARTCNAPGKYYCSSGNGCSDCWRKDPEDLNLLYGRAAPCFNTKKWPDTLSKIADSWKISRTWKLLGGRWGSGAWGCNPTFSLMVQGLAACNGNWKDLTICGTSQETSGGKCVCVKPGVWDKEVYREILGSLKRKFDHTLWKCSN